MILFSVVLRLLAILLLWVPKVRERVSFERKNAADPHTKKFSENADIAFEFSSEGEFQQVLPLITDAVAAGKKLELIYFSPSVEKGVRELCEKYPGQIRSMRYPLLTGGFLQWITAPRLVLVRYDFFPEFLLFPGELNIVWMTFKKERVKNKNISWWKKKFLARATNVVYATEEDAKIGKELGKRGPVFDFRIVQIQRRLEGKAEKFARIFPEYESLGIQKYPREKRLIVGNAWPSDLQVLKDIPKDFYVLVVPHKLEPEIIRQFDGFNVLNKKGVLCELYADFGFAYVGGGFETSIHSVLEPLISGADKISCGLITYRSTEFDIVKSAGKMTVVKDSQEFHNWLASSLESRQDHVKMAEDYPKYRKAIISC